jgi:hypothetical protein
MRRLSLTPFSQVRQIGYFFAEWRVRVHHQAGRQIDSFWDLPSQGKYQRRILPIILIAETERQRLWRARGIILAKIRLIEVFEQIDWPGVGTEEPQSIWFLSSLLYRTFR